MKRVTRIILVLIFALLQCVAPFAHAHLGGDPAGQSGARFHVHEIQQQLDHISSVSNGNTVEPSDAPVISMQQSKPRAAVQHAFDQPLIQGYDTPRPAPAALGMLPVKPQSADASPPPPSLFRKQHPQAPPSLV